MGLHGTIRRYRRRFSSAFRALRLDETSYRLDIREISGFRVAFRKDTADESVLSDSFDNDIFFPGMPEYQPRPDDVVIDVGAHIGTFSLLAASRTPQGVVHAIEASKETFNYLSINTALNTFTNLRPHHLALSDSKGMAMLHHDSGNWGHSIMKVLSSEGEQVETDTLDNFMRNNNIDRCALIKFNCEGAEFPILMSASIDVLAKIEKMLILYHEDLVAGARADQLIERLSNAGFTIKRRNQEKQRGWIIAIRDTGAVSERPRL